MLTSFGTGIGYRMAGQSNNKKMNSSKVNTKYNNRSWVRNISAGLALMLAAVTLLQANTAKSSETEIAMTAMEAELIAEIDQMLFEEDMSLEESVLLEVEKELTVIVNVFNQDNELIASGNPDVNSELRQLMNKADYLSNFGKTKYFKISE